MLRSWAGGLGTTTGTWSEVLGRLNVVEVDGASLDEP